MVEQDRRLEGQRLQERRDQAAELAATALQRTVAELEERLRELPARTESDLLIRPPLAASPAIPLGPVHAGPRG